MGGQVSPRHYFTVTWDQLHRDARALAWRLADPADWPAMPWLGSAWPAMPWLGSAWPAMPWRGIVAVTRGGMIPAAIVARELEIRLVETVSVVTYGQAGGEETEMGAPTLLKPPSAAGDGTGFLVIDDLADTGATARLVRGILPAATFACVYAKPAGRALVDSFVTEVSQDTWILFPWDTEPQFSVPLVRRDRPG